MTRFYPEFLPQYIARHWAANVPIMNITRETFPSDILKRFVLARSRKGKSEQSPREFLFIIGLKEWRALNSADGMMRIVWRNKHKNFQLGSQLDPYARYDLI